MKIWLSFLVSVLLSLPHSLHAAESQMPATEEKAVRDLLTSFHEAAAKAQFDDYFSKFAPDAVFLGTDASERWTVEQFKAYVAPHFAKGKGWTYKARERHVSIQGGNVAWFDEILDSSSYGVARGSGVLLKSGASWKIAQYNLSFPIPNELAKEFTETIKKSQKKPDAPKPR